MKDIFDPVDLRNISLKNRIVRSATWEGLADIHGHMTDELYGIYEGLASGGIGAIITGFTSVADNDSWVYGAVKLSRDDLIPEHERLTALIHAHKCPVIVQLALGDYYGLSIDAMTVDDIHRVRDMFVSSAKRAKRSGYDGVQIHAAHGFFLSRSISPSHNHRRDSYGGNTAKRSRLLTEIIRAVREISPGFHVSMKINSSDFTRGGLEESESLNVCKLCENSGLDSIEVSGNGTSVPGILPGINEGYFKDFALTLSGNVSIPVILVGGLRSMGFMNDTLNAGEISCLSLSRPLIREPDLLSRWKGGDSRSSQCVSCNMCYRTAGHRCIFSL